jgi:hypothetical protein
MMTQPVEGQTVRDSMKREVDDALMLLQYAVARGIDVPPDISGAIPTSVSASFPDAFSSESGGEEDSGTAETVDENMADAPAETAPDETGDIVAEAREVGSIRAAMDEISRTAAQLQQNAGIEAERVERDKDD